MLTDWLVRRFVADADKVDDPRVRGVYGKLAGITGIVANVSCLSARCLPVFCPAVWR